MPCQPRSIIVLGAASDLDGVIVNPQSPRRLIPKRFGIEAARYPTSEVLIPLPFVGVGFAGSDPPL